MLSGNSKRLWSCIALGFPFWCDQQSLLRCRWPWQQGLLNFPKCPGWGLSWWGGTNSPVVPLTEPGIWEGYGLWVFGMACLVPADLISCFRSCFMNFWSVRAGGALEDFASSMVFYLYAGECSACLCGVGPDGLARKSSERFGRVGGWLWEGRRVAEGLQWQAEVSSHGGGLPPPSLLVGACCPWPLPSRPSLVQQCLWEAAGRAGGAPQAVVVRVLMVSCLPPRQCRGLRTEKGGGSVSLPQFLMCGEEEWLFCRFIFGL